MYSHAAGDVILQKSLDCLQRRYVFSCMCVQLCVCVCIKTRSTLSRSINSCLQTKNNLTFGMRCKSSRNIRADSYQEQCLEHCGSKMFLRFIPTNKTRCEVNHQETFALMHIMKPCMEHYRSKKCMQQCAHPKPLLHFMQPNDAMQQCRHTYIHTAYIHTYIPHTYIHTYRMHTYI
jgi:hypothetical protein